MMSKTVVIDNYDSFTFNLVRYIEIVTGEKPVVFRNDCFDLSEIEPFEHIVLSPGPGLPKDAGKTMLVLERFYNLKKILGICLGHQAIGEFFGGELFRLKEIKHGETSTAYITQKNGLFKGLNDKIKVGRYHSWAVASYKLPKDLKITSVTSDDVIMSFRHRILPVYGIQFHPESVLTPDGLQIIRNYYDLNV